MTVHVDEIDLKAMIAKEMDFIKEFHRQGRLYMHITSGKMETYYRYFKFVEFDEMREAMQAAEITLREPKGTMLEWCAINDITTITSPQNLGRIIAPETDDQHFLVKMRFG